MTISERRSHVTSATIAVFASQLTLPVTTRSAFNATSVRVCAPVGSTESTKQQLTNIATSFIEMPNDPGAQRRRAVRSAAVVRSSAVLNGNALRVSSAPPSDYAFIGFTHHLDLGCSRRTGTACMLLSDDDRPRLTCP